MSAQRVRAKEFRDIVQVSDPRLSPDGSEVAFVRTVPDDEERYEATIYVVPTDEGLHLGGAEDEADGGDE